MEYNSALGYRNKSYDKYYDYYWFCTIVINESESYNPLPSIPPRFETAILVCPYAILLENRLRLSANIDGMSDLTMMMGKLPPPVTQWILSFWITADSDYWMVHWAD